MSKQRQFRRGTTAQHSTFVGALAEVTVDVTKNAVVVHDGNTPGGFPAQREIDIRSNASSLGGAPQSINFTNGVGASGSNGAFTVGLSNTSVTPGSYGPAAITVDGTGRITAAAVATSIASATTANQLAAPRTINLTGDVSGSVSSDFSGTVNVPTTLAPSGVTAGTYERVTVNSRGLVTAGSNPLPVREHLRTLVPTGVWVEAPLDAGYVAYDFEFFNVSPATIETFLAAQLSNDGGATWIQNNIDYIWNVTGTGGQAGGTAGSARLSYVSVANASVATNIRVTLTLPISSGHHVFKTSGASAGGGTWGSFIGIGASGPVARCNRVRFAWSNDSWIAQGTILQRGIRAA